MLGDSKSRGETAFSAAADVGALVVPRQVECGSKPPYRSRVTENRLIGRNMVGDNVYLTSLDRGVQTNDFDHRN